MRVKVAQYIVDFLVDMGTEHVFTVTGGGAMHLNDALGHKEGLTCIYNHHEQACAIAAEGYARYTGKIAAVCVTTGPGGTNAITGVVGGWQDSIPMFVISGQVKRETTTWSTDVPLRQLGDQEFQIVECVSGMTKYAKMITEPTEIRYHLEKAWYLANNGRKGPVWIDVPIDVQAAWIETDELKGFESSELAGSENPVYDKALTAAVHDKIKTAKRPVILAGTGVRLSGAYDTFRALADKLQIPVVTAWNAHDLLEEEYPYYCGRPGSVGTRGGNFVVQNSDLLIVLGCRMNIRQISYNYKEFAKRAYKIVVDIDEAELRKPTVKVDLPIHADLKDVMKEWLDYDGGETA
ncbi:MAG: thiamine pyrophosphate-binding protein, partial [Lachnospiraceae bacterium]|nr:thiamine pyrophosphate-binding protein [Lachnospiraceae bacterium]